MIKAKPFDIPKREVWEAFKRVKANQGAAGVDGQSIYDFEAELSTSLGDVISGWGESPTFPLARLAGAGLCSLFSTFRFGMAETRSIFHGDQFSRR